MATPAQLREEVSAVADDATEAFSDLLHGVPRSQTLEVVNDELPGLILLYGEQAAVIAAEWYEDSRSALGVAGRFIANPSTLPEVGADGLIGWAAKTANSFPSMLSLIQGGTFKRVANAARLTVMDNAARDPQATGVQRYARTSGGCSFCQMLAGRGAVYRTDLSASFAAHDNCKCVAVPAFTGAPLPVQPYTPTDRHITDADRARVRDWIASNL